MQAQLPTHGARVAIVVAVVVVLMTNRSKEIHMVDMKSRWKISVLC